MPPLGGIGLWKAVRHHSRGGEALPVWTVLGLCLVAAAASAGSTERLDSLGEGLLCGSP